MAADFETTTDPRDCRVWSWGVAEVSEKPSVLVGKTVTDFMVYLNRWKNSVVWFHNLKFDGSFILDWLLRRRFKHTKERKVPKGHFSSLISDTGQFYQIVVVWKNGHRTLFQDSLKKIPFSIEHVAEAFELETAKGSIDYEKPRPIGYEPTPEEWEYVRTDVEILARALAEQLKNGRALTIGADSLSNYKKTLGGAKAFEKYFPVLDHDTDTLVRSAYRGGYTYANPRYAGRAVGAGTVYDVNSLYPSVMNSKPLPYGLPYYFNGAPPAGKTFIVSITFTAKVKPGYLPCIQVKGNMYFSPTEYLNEVSEVTTMSVTNIDLALIEEHYDLDILTYNGGVWFETETGFFGDYIEHWSHVKETSKGGQREIAKLFLNSLYGKFATNPDVTGRVPVLDPDEDRVKLVDGERELRDPVYTAMGVFITSYARDIMVRTAQRNFDRFLYCDTDSVHLLGRQEPAGVEVHGTRMGCWAHEYDFARGKFLRAKQYAEELDDGSTVVRIAGAPRSTTDTVTVDNLKAGMVLHGKLVPVSVPGGTVLAETTFTVK